MREKPGAPKTLIRRFAKALPAKPYTSPRRGRHGTPFVGRGIPDAPEPDEGIGPDSI